MLQRKTIVRFGGVLTKAQLHDNLMIGWQRMIAKFGKGAVAEALDVSTVAIDKQLSGSMPDFALIMSAYGIDCDVLDEVADAYGVRIVAKDAACDADDLNLMLARAMLAINEAQHPSSAGGRAIVHSEYLAAEELMRQLHNASGNWLEQCSQIRKPREVRA